MYLLPTHNSNQPKTIQALPIDLRAVSLLAGKGWYNLNERNYETYCFSKMRSLLAVTRFMMEDTLRSLVMDNHAKFVAFVAAVCSAKVSIVYTCMDDCLLLCSCLHRQGGLCRL